MFPVGVSLAVSYVSGVTLLGNTAEIYFYGITFCLYYVGSTVAMMTSAFLIVPVYHPLGITSINEVRYARCHQ